MEMHTRGAFAGTGSAMEANEIPAKQYMSGGGGGFVPGQGNQGLDAERPAMGAARHRRSSSGVYDDEGLASAAAIAALYKQDPANVAPQTVHGMRNGNDNDQSSVVAEAGSVQNGTQVPPPRNGNHPAPEISNISNDNGGYNFPKTLRRQQNTDQSTGEQIRPAIPLSQRSLRRPHAQASRTSGITSYIRLGSKQPLPTPSRALNTPVHMVPEPQNTGPAGAKTMRGSGADMEETTRRESAVNLPPPQGAAAAGLMTDYGSTSTGTTLVQSDIPTANTTASTAAQHAQSRPQQTQQYTTEDQTMNRQMPQETQQYTIGSQNMNSQKPVNPYMPQPQNIAQNDLTQDFQKLNIEQGEGAHIAKKTLRHKPDVPDLQEVAEQQPAQPVVQERVPLTERSLRRPSQGRESTGTGHGFLGKIKEKLKGDDKRQDYEIQNQQSGNQQQQSNVDYKSKFGGGREILESREVDTTVHESVNPAVVHEHLIPVIHNVEQEQITRDIHHYDVYDRILPVKEHIELPPRHYTPDARGKLREMTPQELEAEKQGLGQTMMPNQQRERILVSESTVTSPGGTQHTESVWRYPEEGEVMPAMNTMSSTMSASANGKPAPSAATRPGEPVRTFSRTPRDGDVLISTPLQALDQQGTPSPGIHPVRYAGNTPGIGARSDLRIGSNPSFQSGGPITGGASGFQPAGIGATANGATGYDGGIGGADNATFAVPPKSPKRALSNAPALSTAAKAASAAAVVGSPVAAKKAASIPLPTPGMTPLAAPLETPKMGGGTPTGRAAVLASPGMNGGVQKAASVPLPTPGMTPLEAPAAAPKMGSGTPTGRAAVLASPGLGTPNVCTPGNCQEMGTVTMGGDNPQPGIPPPNPVSHQSVHATARNDLGPTYHTDIDFRRPDTHEMYAGLDSDAYLGPGYHEMNLRRGSVEKEWHAVPKPSSLEERMRDDRSPVGERPSRPTPVPRVSEQMRHKQPSSMRQNITSRMPSVEGARNTMSGMQQSAQQGAQQRMNAVRTTSQRFVQPVTNRMPSSQTVKNAASQAQNSTIDRLPSGNQVKGAAMAAGNRLSNAMPETTQAVNNIREHPREAVKYAGGLASNFASGVRSLMPDHLQEEVTTPHPPGSWDDSEEFTYSDHIDSPDSERDSESSDSSLSSPAREELEKDMADLEAITRRRRDSNPGDPPTVLEFQNKIIPGGVVKGAHAIVGPAVLMENKKIEEQMSMKRLRRMSQHESNAVNQLTTGKKAMITPIPRTMSHQNRDGDTATKMRELQIAEAEREREQSERIQQNIQKNILREEHDEFEIAKKIRREADRALQEAKRTKSPQHIDLAHKLEKEYQDSLAQNQRVLKQNYRSGLGVTVGQGMTEMTKHHSGKFDGVREGTGPTGFSPKHSTFPTGFEQSMHTAEGMMGEGTESENPYNYHPPSNTAPNHFHPSNHPMKGGSSFQRPTTKQRHSTDRVITNHTVFPSPEIPKMEIGTGLRKSNTIATQPSTRPSVQGTTSQRFVKPLSMNLKHATEHSPNVIATQLTEGSHSVIHPNALNVQQHMTRPVDHNARTPTNALELDPIPAYTQPISHEVDVGMHTQAIPIDPSTHSIARDPVHPHTSVQIPTHPAPHHLTTAPVKHPLTRTPSQGVPIGAFPVFTQEVSHPADVGTPTQAVPIDPLTHTIPKDPLHFISASIEPIIPTAPSPPGEERKRDLGVIGSPTDMSQVSVTTDSSTSPSPMEPTACLSKSQKKKMKRKAAKAAEQDRSLESMVPETDPSLPEDALARMDRAMASPAGSPLPIKEPAEMVRPGASSVVGGVRPMSWAAVAKEREMEGRIGEGEVKLM